MQDIEIDITFSYLQTKVECFVNEGVDSGVSGHSHSRTHSHSQTRCHLT